MGQIRNPLKWPDLSAKVTNKDHSFKPGRMDTVLLDWREKGLRLIEDLHIDNSFASNKSITYLIPYKLDTLLRKIPLIFFWNTQPHLFWHTFENKSQRFALLVC